MAKRPPIGRPTAYKPEYCEMLIEHFKKGKSYTAFGAFCGVSKQTLFTWEQKHPEFLDSKKTGYVHYQAWWEEQGQEGLYDQVFMESDGSKRILKLNAAVWIYNMKCRFREDWFDSKDIKAEVKDTTDEEKRARIEKKKENLKRLMGLK